MPIWPFKLRRRKTMVDTIPEPLSEKSQNLQGPPNPVSQPASTSNTRKRRSRQTVDDSIEKVDNAHPSPGKENIEGGYRRKESVDEVTALPVKWKLEHSPHLRPVDSTRAEIPYNFNNAASQTSVGRAEGSSKPGTLRSKRSTTDGTPLRRKSSKKRPDQRLREEEIRAMSASMPTPKRAGEGPLRRDSYKRRTFTSTKESTVSLPQTDDIARSPAVVERNGWEVKEFWYNPRPPVRISQVPQYTYQPLTEDPLPLSHDMSQKVKGKQPVASESSKRYRTIGDAAEELDSSNIRAVLERDAKRKEERDRRRQERLERKLRDVDKSRRSSRRQDHDLEKSFEAGIVPAVPIRPDLERAQSSVHPALRDEPMLKEDEVVGLGVQGVEIEKENPFATPVATPGAEEERRLETGGTTVSPTPLETPFDDPVIETAREVRMATAVTPPLSPVEGRRRSSGIVPMELPARATATSPTGSIAKRSGSESRDRRAGAWASFFKRGGTQREQRGPAETSFANTSRESMGRQPLPLHLVTETQSPFQRSATGVPSRTQSKFREDLPDAPLSPPDSRVQSPELPTNAAAIAAAAAARHADQSTQAGAPNPADATTAENTTARSDTPVSPVRGHMSASMASVDSEGSWLASGQSAKRASAQSGMSRGFGSLSRRTPEFNASFEDLGSIGDKDAEYMQAQRASRSNLLSGSTLAGASVAEDDDDNEIAQKPLTVHESLRRVPTLVHRDPVVRSREGLLSEYAAGETGDSAIKDDSEEDMNEDNFESARGMTYGVRHARQVSAGSAKLLDVAPRRMSTPLSSPTNTKVAEE